jgi:eukaryotic-like serine/threonine-protein kinase
MALTCQRCHRQNTPEAKYCFHCGALLEMVASPDDPLIGKVLLGRYRVLEILGEGGMGKVYLAEQRMGSAARKVAIKTLHPELGSDPQTIARFHRECETVIALSHPNTVQFYDFGEVDGTLLIVMEYIEGESLAHVLERGPIEPARIDRLVIQICGSLSEAHQRGVVHRDLKPDNVLLTERGGQHDFVKVLDFGIAKRYEAEDPSQAKLTKQGMVLGTPPYMSPEQFSGQPLDARSDVYSLGLMIYEMLTGCLPFEAQTPWEWATKHLTTEPTPLEAHPAAAQLPQSKREAVMRALVKDPAGRYGSVLELMHAFTGLNDPSNAWTLATTPGALATGSSQATGPTSRADLAYAATMATPASGQMAATTGPQPTTGDTPVATGSGVGRVLLVLGVLVVLGGGAAAAGLAYWMTRDGGGPAEAQDTAAALPTDEAVALAEETPQGVPSTPSEEEPPLEEASERAAMEPEAEAPAPEAEAPPAPAPRKAAAKTAPAPRPRPDPAPATNSQAQAFIQQAQEAIGRNDLDAAANALVQARRSGGSRLPALRTAQGELARRASNQVGILMQQGRCTEAQALYRRLRAAGAERPSGVHFSDDWCPRP